jgi:heme A synthase
LFLVATGAEVTSHQVGLDQIHRWAGAVVGLLTLGLSIWLRRLGWVLFALAVALAITRGAAHAFLAQLFFAAMVAIALVTSSGWKREPEMVDDMSTPPLRSCALVMVALVVLQVALGAAVRHKAMGPTWHIVGALVVALAILLVGVLVLNQCPTHRTLRPCAIIMMTIAGAQVFLGFAAFIVRMMADESTLPVVISTVAHVTTGALTLAATVVVTLQIRRHFRQAAQASAVVP